jgi:dTDP-4-amino-4,6-dideoxygalactose transaminase
VSRVSRLPRIFLSPPHVGAEERKFILAALDSNWIAPLGPDVDAFEREMCGLLGARSAVALSSGTAALHLALHCLGVGPGDEVLVSTLTFAATANAVKYCGASPVFIDSRPSSWTMDPDLLADEIAACAASGKLPRAVIAVDLYGQCADYDALRAVCEPYGIPLVEDAAEALGASYKGRPAGALGYGGILSFNGNKMITTSGGGMLVSDDVAFVDRARYLASQARQPAAHYEHTEVGFNYRLSNLLAALGRAQLMTLESRVRQRRSHRAFYQQELGLLPGLHWMPEAAYGISNGWLTCCTIDPLVFGADSKTVRVNLEGDNIECRPVWKPMHLQPVFASCRRRGGAVAEGLFENGLCLPSGSGMTSEERERVVQSVHQSYQNNQSAKPRTTGELHGELCAR